MAAEVAGVGPEIYAPGGVAVGALVWIVKRLVDSNKGVVDRLINSTVETNEKMVANQTKLSEQIEVLRVENRDDHKSTSAKVDTIQKEVHELTVDIAEHLAWHQALGE